MENSKPKTGNSKHKLLKAVFARAKELGVSQEMLRDTIAPAVINKRLSSANAHEIAKVVDYITRRANPKHETLNSKPKRYESSRAGLIEEVKDLAIARYGQDFVRPLNALCERFKVEGYRSLRVNQAKAVKATLIRLQREDPRGLQDADCGLQNEINPKPEIQNLSSTQIGDPKSKKVLIFHKGRKGFLNQLGEMDRRG